MTDEQTPTEQPVDTGETSKAVTQTPLEPNHQNDSGDGFTNRPVALITDPAPLPPDTVLGQIIGTPGPLGLGGANDPDEGGINAHLKDGNAPGLGGGKSIANQGGDNFIEAAAGLPTFDKTSADYFRSDVLDTSTETAPGPNAEQTFPTGTYGPIGEQVAPTGQPVQEIDASHEHATSANVVDEATLAEATAGTAQDAHTNQQEVAAPLPEGATPSTFDTGSATPNAVDETILPPQQGAADTSDLGGPLAQDTDPTGSFTSKVPQQQEGFEPVAPAVVETPAAELQDPTNTVTEADPAEAEVLSGVQPASGLANDVDTSKPGEPAPVAEEEDLHDGGADEDDEATVVQDTPPAEPTESAYDASADPVLTGEDPAENSQYADDESIPEATPSDTPPYIEEEIIEQAPTSEEPTAGEPVEDEPVTQDEQPLEEPVAVEAAPEPAPAVEDAPAEEEGPYTRTTQNPDADSDHTVMPKQSDRKEDWYDYAQTQGFTGEYEDHTKAWFISNYGSKSGAAE